LILDLLLDIKRPNAQNVKNQDLTPFTFICQTARE
jgi:hypothetical protein